ncbi:BrnA antitoxin family protein [Octadecabacter sp. G9-8]|uniref:BrnA antitoxin family protein n=1 Tax=Octadecabacter dasysiphoniae TaxID=2909341 RepID=A0ABS9D0Y0_9RHOB|nr:BrnA antitoxin family protein [Octadecabacter dasysiphoniae]MCF2872972.1 BrnA antitoxin family protein [Octadecabacter dasysiphoniae]
MRKADPKEMTKTDRKHWGFGVDAMKMIEHDLMGFLAENRALPRDWDKIWEDQDKRDPKRVKVTISLDEDVVRFFKGLGPGYQPRINRVLRAFMHFRLAKIIEGPDTMDYILRPDDVLARAHGEPQWGDTARQIEAFETHNAEMEEKADKRRGPKKRVLKGTERPWIDDPLRKKGR